MVLCSKCKKNMAVVFVTKMENGKEVSEGLCFQCAKEMGIKPFDKMLSQFGINEDDFMHMNEELTEMMEQGAIFGDNMMMMPMDEMPEGAEIRPEDIGIKQKNKKQKNKKKTPLESYGTNLNDKARLGEIDAVIGREAEINRVIHILNRRTKNNPVLLGEPGVGKTAIAEGLALNIVNGVVPHKLLNAQIFLVDFAGMI
ncbi:MAG: ATP-dependent Clp protease ATP-binding subunit, partial [Clostridia bacterium]|nr:ATP-dependent Clp protease ATP-binding subunit [Clostridia bacterium]